MKIECVEGPMDGTVVNLYDHCTVICFPVEIPGKYGQYRRAMYRLVVRVQLDGTRVQRLRFDGY